MHPRSRTLHLNLDTRLKSQRQDVTGDEKEQIALRLQEVTLKTGYRAVPNLNPNIVLFLVSFVCLFELMTVNGHGGRYFLYIIPISNLHVT